MLLKYKALIFALVLILVSAQNVFATEKVFNEQVCSMFVAFDKKPQIKQQTVNVNANIQLKLSNVVSVNSDLAARIATNVSCQTLTGASYTGSKEEWLGFFDSAIKGLRKANYKELEFTLVGSEDKVYNDEKAQGYISKEYTYIGTIDDNKQIIKNLALLDKSANTLYTFSVSGNVMVKDEVTKEFFRLVASIKQPK